MNQQLIDEIHTCYAYPCKKRPVKYFVLTDLGEIPRKFCQAFCQDHLWYTNNQTYNPVETDYDTWLNDAYPKWERIMVMNVMQS